MKPSFNKNYKEYKNYKNYKSNSQDDVKDKSVSTKHKKQEFKKTATNPVKKQDSQIISGYFLPEKPYKELVIQRVNNFLYGVLAFLVLLCLVCYYFVSCKEVQLNQISRETLELNYENEELQNKVDSLQSYYNIDKAVSKTNILERAKHVVEVDAKDISNVDINALDNKDHSLVVGY